MNTTSNIEKCSFECLEAGDNFDVWITYSDGCVNKYLNMSQQEISEMQKQMESQQWVRMNHRSHKEGWIDYFERSQ